MNHRVLELLKAPKNIQSEDLNLLKEEINSFPYVQNIRALYLYGVHLYDKENYQKVLSATAAYTTDKKILYQLINGKIQLKPEVRVKPDYAENPLKKLYQSKVADFPIQKEKEDLIDTIEEETVGLVNQETSGSKGESVLPAPQAEIKHLYVKGERNRILFEGEENFLEDDQAETIDLESTLESGSIVTQKIENKTEDRPIVEENKEIEEQSTEIPDQEVVEEIEEFIPEINIEKENASEVQNDEVKLNEKQEIVSDESENADITETPEEFTSEIIIEGQNIDFEAEKKEILDESEVSFHEIEPFISETQNNEIEENKEQKIAESENVSETDLSEGFIPETIIEEENISLDVEKEEILNESEISFQEAESIVSEIQNDQVEESIDEESDDVNETAEFTPEKIINEDKISSEKEQKSVNDESELSFHGTESFLPEVKIQPNNSDETKNEAVEESSINKHEDEMRRLIEEVEKKMKEKVASAEIQKIEAPETVSNDISFAETQSFTIKPTVEEPKIEEKTQDLISSQPEIVEESKEEITEQEEVRLSWKPMSFESHVPDSLINKSSEIPQPKVEKEVEKIEETQTEENSVEETPVLVEEISNESGNQIDKLQADSEISMSEETTEEKEEAPVMNVSFFGSDISKLKSAESKKETEKEEVKEEKSAAQIQQTTPNPLDSNVPGFINTWQSWLKIDRVEDVEKEKSEIKTKAIETFIENNPKISQLKDESSYVVKEKNDDISHLMTETLAILYFEQKLYTKAIKAFEILIKKSPEKKEYYEGKIQEIKDFRSR